MKAKYCIFICLLCIGIGFLGGRRTIPTKEKLVKLAPISGTSEKPVADREEIPVNPVLPVKADTVWMEKIAYVAQKVDTAAIIQDYISKRSYNLTLFDNEMGRLVISPVVQYNKLEPVSWSFTPIQKQIYRQPKWQFFAGAGVNTFDHVNFSLGAFRKKVGVECYYIRDMDLSGASVAEHGFGIGVKYKF
jgi:hypothetical protein